jgi:hypothetical protein
VNSVLERLLELAVFGLVRSSAMRTFVARLKAAM